MSTPPEMQFEPVDRSPYAPKNARLRAVADANEPPLESGRDTVDPPLGATRVVEQHAGADSDGVEPLPSPEPYVVQASESEARAEPGHEPEFDRLEAGPHWLEREPVRTRLPRAQQLPPILGLRTVATKDAPRQQFINGVRVPPSLARERLRQLPAMRGRGDNLRAPLRILVASLLAAPIAYYVSMVKFTSWSSSSPPPKTELVSLASKAVTPAQFPDAKDEGGPSEAEDYQSLPSGRSRTAAQPDASNPPASIPAQAVPDPPAAPEPVRADAQSTPLRALDPKEVKRLLQQGQQYLAAGDFASARQVFRRAAEAGDAAAALALGASFDPTVLAKFGGAGSADIEKARNWYEKAKTYGSTDAARRLETLANR